MTDKEGATVQLTKTNIEVMHYCDRSGLMSETLQCIHSNRINFMHLNLLLKSCLFTKHTLQEAGSLQSLSSARKLVTTPAPLKFREALGADKEKLAEAQKLTES